MSKAQRPISIIGAGIAGLSLAQCLRSRGIPAIVYDKHTGLKRHDYGMILQRKTYKPLLKHLEISERLFCERLSVLEQSSSTSTTNLRANRWALEEVLREGLDIRWRHAVKFVTPSGRGGEEVLLFFENNECVEARCVVAADGVHSTLRGLVLPGEKLEVLPYVVFNGRRRLQWVKGDDSGLDAVFKKVEGVTQHVGSARSTRVNLAAAGNKGEDVNVSYTLSRLAAGPEDQALLERSADKAQEKSSEFLKEIDGLGPLPNAIAGVRKLKDRQKGPLIHWLMRLYLIEAQALTRIAEEGRITFLGDAAHTFPILGGQGANAAITDAIRLAEHISPDGQSLDHDSFYKARYGEWERLRDEARTALAELHSNGRPAHTQKASL